MGKTILITGGARSGKSGIAETMTLSLGRPAIYIATASGQSDLALVDLPVTVSPTPAAGSFEGGFDPAKSYREIRSAYEAEFERAYVSWLLERHDGNISAAAREAKMDRKHLYDLARRHNLR